MPHGPATRNNLAAWVRGSPVADPDSAWVAGSRLGIVQVIGAILQRLGFRASSEKIGLELPLFTFELLDFLLECGDAFQGIAMATLPISDLLAEFEILALQALYFGATPPLPGSSSRLSQSTPERSRLDNRPVPVGRS